MMKSIVPTGRIRIDWADDVAIVTHTDGDLIPFAEEFIKELYDGEMEEATIEVLDSFSFRLADCIFYYVGEDFLSLSFVYRIFKPVPLVI